MRGNDKVDHEWCTKSTWSRRTLREQYLIVIMITYA